MAEGEEPASEQAGGSTPPPGLGVPPLGAPGTGSSPSSPATPPLGQGQPEIVEDYYPYLDPRGTQQQPAPRRPRFRLTISRMILLAFIVLAVSGAIATQLRHAHATPADKQACSTTLGALSNITRPGMAAMLHDLEFANDKTLLGARGDMTTDIRNANVNALGNDLNRVINRCNQLSSDFKSGFKTFCDSHPGYCKQTFHIGPF